jgi:hypothetical protein
MPTDREAKVSGIKQQIEQGQYRVDSRAVADAILRRLGERWALTDHRVAYNKCSYPDNSGADPPNETPAAP